MADMIVSGAGTSAVNGTYVENGTVNGKPKYTYGDYVLGVYYVYAYDSNNWVIRTISVPPTTYYYNDNYNIPDTPDLVSSWWSQSGSNPPPTVTAAGGSAQNLTLSCGAGSLALTGTAATMTVQRNYTLACDAGSYTITGTNADITSSRTLICEPASGGAYPDIIVSGAGTSNANGTYLYLMDLFGRPLYKSGDNSIWWYDSKWAIINAFESGNRYESTEDVATPDLVTTWTVGVDGTLPVPTVISGTNAYTLTGTDVTLTYTQGAQNLTLTCEAGSYTLTGTDVSFGNTKAYELVCGAGSYALTGSDIAFVIARSYSLTCNAGSYTLTGAEITLATIHTYSLACNSGSYLLTGRPTSLTSARSLACNSGSYLLTGLEADLFKGLVLPCGNGSYALTGSPATVNSARTFVLGMGSYVLVGTNAGLFILTATPECRTYFIDAENRTWLIDSEDRTRVIDAENRTMEVRCH